MQVNLLSDYILQKLNKDIKNESSRLEKEKSNGKKRIFQKRDKTKHR